MPNPFQKIWNQFQAAKDPMASVKDWAATLAPAQKHIKLQLTAASIRQGEVIRWENLNRDPTQPNPRPQSILTGWERGHDGRYVSVVKHSPEMVDWLIEKSVPWTGDLQEVTGLTSSKSSLEDFTTVSEFATSQCADLLADSNQERLKDILDWPELNLATAALCQDSWDGRVFLNNNGGSHHFAAGQQMAAQLGVGVQVSGTIRQREINHEAIEGLCEYYEMFVLSDEPQVQNTFLDTMAKIGASYFTMPLPSNSPVSARVVLLPQGDVLSTRVAEVMRKAGFVDFGETLMDLAIGFHRHDQSELTRLPNPRAQPPTLGQAAQWALQWATPTASAPSPAETPRVRRDQKRSL